MVETSDLIDALAGSKTADANNTFNALMQDKISSALDARKIEIANQVYNGVEPELQQEPVDADVQTIETESDAE